jgi:two-component system OmpR family response regulator
MSDAPKRILVVDDEESILNLIGMTLRYQSFSVETAQTGREAISAVAKFHPELVILDVMLPDMDGFEVARRLGSQQSRVPILFLTALGSTEDKVQGLTLGGDDYMTKPFSLEELVARVLAILRRSSTSPDQPTKLVFEDIELDDEVHEVRRADKLIELTITEYRLLRYFMINPQIALSRNQILDYVWEYDFGGDARVLETYVSYLRKKLGAPSLIKTVRGIGYSLRAEAE